MPLQIVIHDGRFFLLADFRRSARDSAEGQRLRLGLIRTPDRDLNCYATLDILKMRLLVATDSLSPCHPFALSQSGSDRDSTSYHPRHRVSAASVRP